MRKNTAKKKEEKLTKVPATKKQSITDETIIKESSICLVMIVKDEAKVIKRCIDSVKDYIKYWVIVDTGSTDGTQELIKDIMGKYNIPGELHERPWVDYGHNRTESLQYSKGKCDYRLIIDADDVLVTSPGINPFKNLDKDSYKIKIRLNPIAYYRTQLIRGNQDWKYIGVLHEYLSGPSDIILTDDFLDGVEMHASVSGHNRDIKGSDKYYNDALIFEKALITTPKEELTEDLKKRYTFYLAQSYRDAGMSERAIEFYNKRALMGGWDEEIYISKYWVARLKENLKVPDAEIINAYLEAWESRPIRLEALFHLIKFLEAQKRYAFAFALATIAMKSVPCTDVLFVEDEIWKWRMPDEYSVLAYYNGNPEEAFRITDTIVKSKIFESIPNIDRERITKNLGFYLDATNKKKEEQIKNSKINEDI